METIMQKLKTKTKEFQVAWAAVSSVDGAFRAAVERSDMVTVLACFMSQSETETMKLIVDDMTPPKIFLGFSDFAGVHVDADRILIEMRKKD